MLRHQLKGLILVKKLRDEVLTTIKKKSYQLSMMMTD